MYAVEAPSPQRTMDFTLRTLIRPVTIGIGKVFRIAGSSQQSGLDLHRPPSGSRQTPPWFVFEGETDYIRRCFEEYSVNTV